MEKVTLEGVISKITYYNKENGYAVFTVEASGQDDDMTCVGTAPEPAVGESVNISGEIVTHPVYGIQVKIDTIQKTAPTETAAIERYLASGAIKGIGKALAKRIVKHFGDKTLSIIDTEPEKLSEIKGITGQKAIAISTAFQEQSGLRNVLIYLGGYGITPAYAMKIYKQYKEKTIDIIQKNPYALADEVFGIGFNIADDIAARVGIEANSPFRIRAGVKYMLNKAALNGHIYLPIDKLIDYTSQLLKLPPELINDEMPAMSIENSVRVEDKEDQKVYLNFFNVCEKYIARKLIELDDFRLEKKDYLQDILAIESAERISFAPQQREAIQSAMEQGVLVITGGPGTGKTTIINAIINLSEAEGYELMLAAPTGRAAKRMEEATGHTARTIHRMLGYKYDETSRYKQSFEYNEDNPLDTDLIIIDESSMVDTMLMHALLKAVPEGTRLILVGDADQLPSVGAGNVLKDIITSGVIGVVRLTEIFRQSQQSAIVTNAHRINSGLYPELDKCDSDLFFMRRNNVQAIQSLLVELISTRLPKYMNCDPKELQVLTPMRKSPLGSVALNELLQQALNPPHPNKNEHIVGKTIFREGDKVMQIKNDYELEWRCVKNKKIVDEGVGIFNGDEGVINFISDESSFIEVIFDDDKVVHYDFNHLDKLELSYAVTIHKSQGSEYKGVIIPLLSGPEMLMNRNLLYTALTRAKKLAVLVGLKEVINAMVDNNKEINRYTTLSERLKEFSEI